MTMVPPPHFDQRKRKELRAELLARARMWIPEWQPGSGTDVMTALLEIAARLDAEVTQRLDRVPEKSFRGFLHWLGRRGRSGAVARMPVVFRLSDRAEAVLASASVQLQADASGTPVIFETENSVRLIPSRLESVVASKGDDSFYIAFPGLANLDAPKPAPTEWRLVTPAAYGTTQAQLDPPEGLAVDMVLADDSSRKYRVTTAKDGLVTFSDPLGSSPGTQGLPTGLYTGGFRKVSSFAPFDGEERDRQQHALYIGAKETLDVETVATIRLDGELPGGCDWSYWGKRGISESDWQPLDQDMDQPHVLRKTTKGAIEEREVNGKSLRWLRAVPKDPESVAKQTANNIRIAINCFGSDQTSTGQATNGSSGSPNAAGTAGDSDAFIKLEAIANTTPVVLNQGFFPFGREPRQFDAFYLSGPEAFGKPNAFASIDITLADGFNGPLNASANASAALVASVGDDLGLRLVHVLPQANDRVRFLPSTRPEAGPGQPVRFGPQRVGAAYIGDGEAACFSATDGAEAWVWTSSFRLSELPSTLDVNVGGWKRYGRPPESEGNPIAETLLLFGNEALKIYALLQNGKVYWRTLAEGALWNELSGDSEDAPIPPLARLVHFERSDTYPGRASEASGLAGFTPSRELYYCEAAGQAWQKVAGFKPLTEEGVRTYPLALIHNRERTIVTKAIREVEQGGESRTIEAIRIDPAGAPVTTQLQGTLVGDAISFVTRPSQQPAILLAIEQEGRPSLKMWQPFADPEPFEIGLPVTPLRVAQAPARLASGYLLPLEHGAVATSGSKRPPVAARAKTSGDMRSIALWVDASAALPPNPPKQLLELPDFSSSNLFFVSRVGDLGLEMPVLRKDAQDDITGNIHDLGPSFKGTIKSKKKLALDGTDPSTRATIVGTRLCVCVGEEVASGPADTLYEVTDLKINNPGQPNETKVATVMPEFGSASGKRAYFHVTASGPDLAFDIRPTVRLKQPVNEQFELDSVLVEFAHSEFTGKLRTLPLPDGNGGRLILQDSWIGDAPEDDTEVRFSQQASQGTIVTPPAPRNPELSWEYWNGSGWWQISGLTDDTQHLVKSGKVEFCVPADLQPSEVTGRAGSWVRARLVGGDYGQETVRVVTVTNQDGTESTQTVERDPSTIRAPFIVSITVKYELCCAAAPDKVLTFDSGTYRDQSEINLSPNAHVEVFTPLSDSLEQEMVSVAAQFVGKDCHCNNGGTATSAEPVARDTAGAPDGKALYLGFTEALAGQDVSILFAVEETGQAASPRLVVEAFANGRFRPIEAKDETRALTESGIVTLSLPLPLQRVSLFGKSLHWLRLMPEASTAAQWAPRITGIFLNSVWASAGETHRDEVVGRSDGAPRQVFRLAHNAVVDGTLELRIREPLGHEEVEDLQQSDRDNVIEKIGLWTGPWVIWHRGDLATAKPRERIFDFDSALGEITFGDGRRGAIPPIGTDNIVAVVYRSGATAAGNGVGAWNKPNLISPLRGVQDVTTPEGAAGGSDAQNVAQALLYAPSNIAMRDRIVTLADFERQAVQSSPDIVQARAIAGSKGVTIVAVRRGRDPRPTAAMRRALDRHLSDRSSPAFSVPGVLSVVGPTLLSISVSVEVRVADLALAGTISENVRSAITDLLDTATGGFEKRGWPLGAKVSEQDVAAVISDVEGVLAVDRIGISRTDGANSAPGPTQLIVLAESDLQVTCLQSEEEVA